MPRRDERAQIVSQTRGVLDQLQPEHFRRDFPAQVVRGGTEAAGHEDDLSAAPAIPGARRR